MNSMRRFAPLSLALTLALSSSLAVAAPAAPAQKGESNLKSIGQAFKAGVSAYKERRAEAGPGLLKRGLINTSKAVGTGAAATKGAVVSVGKGIGNGIRITAQATARGVRNSLIGRMTIGVADGIRATGRMIAMPFKALARIFRSEKQAIQAARIAKIANNEALGLRELETMAQQGKISQRTKLAVIEARTAAPQSRETVIAARMVADSSVGLRELEQKAAKGEISQEMKQAVIDARLAAPISRASLVTE